MSELPIKCSVSNPPTKHTMAAIPDNFTDYEMETVSHSIWNENPVVYLFCKRVWSTVVSIIFPFAHYCVLTKSPKNFESLKWFLYFHVSCITVEWFSNTLFIDIFDFEPSVMLRIDGLLKYFVDSVLLFRIYCCIEDISSTSALILFCSRLLLIVNMYRRQKSYLRQTVEFFLYFLVVLFGLWSLPFTISSIPDDQYFVKQEIIWTEKYYPDCIMEPACVVVDDPGSGSGNIDAILEIISWVSIAVAILLAARVAYCLLEKRMKNVSSATKRMHKKFNQRTVFQALVYLFFGSLPFTLLYSSMLLKVYIPGLTYFIDFFSENHPTACAVSLFLYYDPYQFYLLQLLRIRNPSDLQKSSIVDRTTVTKI